LNFKTVTHAIAGALAVLVLGSTLAAGASASPVWKFNGTTLTGTEEVVGDAVLSNLTVVGLVTKCKKLHYAMKISNSAGTGKASFNSLSFSTCVTNDEACSVEAIGAEQLPWAGPLATVKTVNYLVLEGVRITAVYAGDLCPVGGFEIEYKGSAGARFDNPTETFAFSLANFSATGTKLSALGEPVEWNGTFSTEATGEHKGDVLTVS
jgi:hypothetical protein